MPSPFLSSEEYDERAHQFYNEGHYDEALEVLREDKFDEDMLIAAARAGRSQYAT